MIRNAGNNNEKSSIKIGEYKPSETISEKVKKNINIWPNKRAFNFTKNL